MKEVSAVINVPISPEFLWLVVLVVLLFFLVFTGILHFHWKGNNIDDNPKVYAKPLYWIVSIILIIIMVSAALIFESK